MMTIDPNWCDHHLCWRNPEELWLVSKTETKVAQGNPHLLQNLLVYKCMEYEREAIILVASSTHARTNVTA